MLPFPILNQYGNNVVPATEIVKKVSTGLNFVAILTSKGNVYTRGINGNGQLGVGDTTTRTTWTLSNTNCADVYCAGNTCIVKKLDASWAYAGYGYPAGFTGSSSTWADCTSVFNSITSSLSGSTILDLKFTYTSTLALRSDYTLWGIGTNARSEITGTANSGTLSAFKSISTSFTPAKIFSGYQCFAATTTDGTFYVSGDIYGLNTTGAVNYTTFTNYAIAGSSVIKCLDFKGTQYASFFITTNTNTNATGIYAGGQQYFGQLANGVDNNSYIATTSITVPSGGTPSKLHKGFSYYSQSLISTAGAYYSGQQGTSTYIGKGGIGTSTNALNYTSVVSPVTISDYSNVSIAHTYTRTYMLYNGVLYSSGTETTYSKDTSSNVYVKDQPTFTS